MNINEILIIGEYPNSKNIKDGMIRRINQIEENLKKNRRCYLNIKFFSNKKKSIEKHENLVIYNLNFFKDFFLIKKIFEKNKKVYLHSLLNYTRVLFFVNKNHKLILDVHGAVVEEMYFHRKNFKAFILKKIEKRLFKKLEKGIFVTKSMESFFRDKYPNFSARKSLIYPIINFDKNDIFDEKIEDKIPEDKVNFVYSGNLQKWQNIDLMLQKLKEVENDRYNYIFLTGQPKEMEEKIKKYQIKNYILRSVTPEKLGYYYQKCDYGLLLRDEHILNHVANPTKLSEYMEYAMIPVVKYEDIGDYLTLGYEYLKIENLSRNLPKVKSIKNIEIVNKIKKDVQEIDFLKFIFD